MSIADRIQTLRKGHGISQEELADIIGVSRQAISKCESGQTTPDIEKIILLSDYFHVTTDYLLKGITPNETTSDSNIDARLFSAIGTAFNLYCFYHFQEIILIARAHRGPGELFYLS